MKKRFSRVACLVLLLLIPFGSNFAQAPSGYYDTADGKTGDVLKAALHQIISGHTKYSYTSSSTDVWDILKEADADPDNPNNVLLIYTNRSVDAAQEYNNGSGWNREHIWAKSRGDFGTSQGPGTDCHALRASDITVNSTRSNRYFAEGGSEVWDEGVFTGCYVGTEDFTFEPRDDIKGDIARMIFYMAVRYEGDDGYPDLELIDAISAKSDKSPTLGLKSTLLQWHLQDPVDDGEVNRNNVVYSYQHNRNPFIDNPEYATAIWGTSTSISTTESTFSVTHLSGSGNFQVTSSTPINHLEIFTLEGVKIYETNSTAQNALQFHVSATNQVLIVRVNHNKTVKIL